MGKNIKRLVVAKYIREIVKGKSGFQVSEGSYDILHKHVDTLLSQAIETAKASGRITVMAKDFPGYEEPSTPS